MRLGFPSCFSLAANVPLGIWIFGFKRTYIPSGHIGVTLLDF